MTNPTFKIVDTYTAASTATHSKIFSIALAEHGYTSLIKKRPYGHIVLAEDGSAVRFVRKSPANLKRFSKLF